MRYLYLLIILLCISVSTQVQAQKYVPFPEHGALWYETFQDDSGPPTGFSYHIKQEDDTMINGISYILLSTVKQKRERDQYGIYYTAYYKGMYGAMREDSSKRVYFYDLKEKTEHLLYDFNMKKGDTIPEYIRYSANYKIIAIDSTLIEKSYRKRYSVGIDSNRDPVAYIIEGIGSTQGLTNRITPQFEIFYSLGCFSLNKKQVFPDTSNYSCEIIVSVNKLVKKDVNFTIFPNPTTGQFTIQTQSIFGESDICVRDILGRIVLQEKLLSSNQTFNMSNQPKGLYFVEFDYIGRGIVQKLILQ
jgi:hypothetical protein